MKIEVYCDGSIYPNPGGPMGWGFIAIDVETGEILMEHSEGRPASHGNSNNRAELAALIRSLQWLQGRTATIFTDSEYTQKGAMHWMRVWAAQGWMKNNKGHGTREVVNASLWKAVLKNIRPNQQVQWVRGHAGHQFNERADRLALQGRNSVTPPQENTCQKQQPDHTTSPTGTERERSACA